MSREEFLNKQDVSNRQKFVIETNQRLNKIENGVNDLNHHMDEVFISQNNLESACASEISEMQSCVTSSLKDFRQCLGDFDSRITKLETSIKQMHEGIFSLVTRDELNEETKERHKSCEMMHVYITQIHKEVHGLIERLKLQVTNQIKESKEEILSRPTGILELQKLIESKIEIVELNGQNSALRSSNNETQIMLLERKIENIYQLIKKIELSEKR